MKKGIAMLVKFESSEDLDENLDSLKLEFDVKTASKACLKASEGFIAQRRMHHYWKKQAEQAREELMELKLLIKKKHEIDKKIEDMINEL